MPSYVFSQGDWTGRVVFLDDATWYGHIMVRRQWNDNRMIPLLRQTISDPDEAYISERNARRAELWRHFTDVKDGSPGYVQVIVEYDTLIGSAAVGDVRTAMVSPAIDSKGTLLWKRV